MSIYDVDAMLAQLAVKRLNWSGTPALVSDAEMRERVNGINKMLVENRSETMRTFRPPEYPMCFAEESKSEKKVVLFSFDDRLQMTKVGMFLTEAEALQRMYEIEHEISVYFTCIVVDGCTKTFMIKERSSTRSDEE